MTKVAVLFLLGILSAGSAFPQSGNTTAGLAGIGAGAALSAANGQGATTPSSAGGGGGSAPIEIQIMVFKGMQDIARNIADSTAVHLSGCTISRDETFQGDRDRIREDRTTSERVLKMLEQHRRILKDDQKVTQPDSEILSESRQRIKDDESALKNATDQLNLDMRQLDTDMRDLVEANNGSCAILIEDPTSYNQIALYQAAQGYYDHLKKLHDQLQEYFSLQVVPSSLAFTPKSGEPAISQTVSVTNVGSNPRKIKAITLEGPNSAIFDVDASDCQITLNLYKYKELSRGESCGITLTFPATQTPAGNYSATLTISSGESSSTNTDTVQTMLLTGTLAPSAEDLKKKEDEQKKLQKELQKLSPQGQEFLNRYYIPSDQVANLAAPAAGGGAPTAPGGPAPSTPLGLTYMSDITTALGGLKSNITYGSSSFQPTTQAFEVLVEAELQMKGIFAYTSTSALNLEEATAALSGQFGSMLVWGNDISNWTNQCKPPSVNPTPNPGGKPGDGVISSNPPNNSVSNSVCAQSAIVADLAVAQQMSTGYTTLLSTSNDGGGNPVIVDVLRGRILSDEMAQGIPSLQVAVASAGGSTKTNSIFGVNLFYTFAPSYNGGIIATFELRDSKNLLLESGARNVLFAYRKWKSKDFHPGELKRASTCDSFCSVENP